MDEDEPMPESMPRAGYYEHARQPYEPPGFRVMMELLRLLAHDGTVTMTITVKAGSDAAQG